MNMKMRSQKSEVRSQEQEAQRVCFQSSAFSFQFPFVFCLYVFASMLLLVGSANANECKLMEPKVLKKYIENGTIYNMVVIDVRQEHDIKMKRIVRAIPATFDNIKKELVSRVGELIGKNVILIGEDTKSAESVCSYMIKKDYGIRNIFVLKGGMEKWDGPILDDISNVGCEVITSQQLKKIMKSNRKVEIIDKRPSEEYYEGHIPEAKLEGGWGNQFPINKFSIKNFLQELERRKKWEKENVTVVYVYDNEWHAMRECRYEKYWTWGYKNIYVLRGGMKVWEGEVKKDYLEILKKRVKEKLK